MGSPPSARKSRKRFGGTLEPLTRVRATWNEKQGRDLHRLEGLELVRSYAAMQAEPARQAACAVLAEIFRAVAREDQPEPHGFRLLGSVLDALEGGLDPFAAVRYAEYWTLRLHGVLADPSACADCGAPLGDTGWASPVSGVLCPDCLRAAAWVRGACSPPTARSCVRRRRRRRRPCRSMRPRRGPGERWRPSSAEESRPSWTDAPGLPAPAGAQRPPSG